MSMLGTNIPVGSLLGIPIKMNVLLPVFLAFQMLTFLSFGAKAVLWAALVFGPILFVTVLIHEFGHSLAARCVGGRADQIILWPLGGLAFISHDSGPSGDLWVTLAGPLTHIPQAGAWLLLAWLMNTSNGPHRPIYDESEFGRSLVGTAFWLNILLMLFNLLTPAYPLDGGRILVDVMLIMGVPAKITAWITIVVAIAVAIAMVVATILEQFFGWGGLLIAAFIAYSTFGLYQYLAKDRIEEHPLFKKASDHSDNPAAEMLPKDNAPAATHAQV